MAEILKAYSFKRTDPVAGRYPWEEWLDGKIRRLTQGKDFTIKPANFQISCHGAARNRKLILHTKREGKKAVVIQATPRNGVNGKKR